MSFGLGQPLALALGLVAILPLIAHLTRRKPRTRVAFGALMLLRRLTRKLRRRMFVRDRLLLLLRLLAVALFVLTASSPHMAWQVSVPSLQAAGTHVIVMDTSLSMAMRDGGSTLWERAQHDLEAHVQSLPEASALALVLCAQTPEVVLATPTTDRALVTRLVAEQSPQLTPCDLSASLLEARRILGADPGVVDVFTDEAGPVMVPRASDELRRLLDLGHTVIPHVVKASEPGNVFMTSAGWSDGVEGGQITLQVQNIGATAREVSCSVRLPEASDAIRVFTTLPPDGQGHVVVTIARDTPGGMGEAFCEDPQLALDNRRAIFVPRRKLGEVLLVDGDPGDTPTESEVYFLERAFSPWGSAAAGVRVRVVGPTGLGSLDPDQQAIVWLANIADPGPIAATLRDYVRRGGTLVLSFGNNAVPSRFNAALGPLLPSALSDPILLASPSEAPVTLEIPSAQTPFFRDLPSVGLNGFSRIGSWRALGLEPYHESTEVQTLLRYTDKTPALVRKQTGPGRVILWTSSVDFLWSNLPLQSSFLVLVQQVLRDAGGAGGVQQYVEQIIGSQVRFPVPPEVREVRITDPTGESVGYELRDAHAIFRVDVPGAYTVSTSAGSLMGYVGAQLDPDESDVHVHHSIARTEVQAKPERFERRLDLTPWVLFAACGLWFLSVLLAGFKPDQRVPAGGVEGQA